MENTSIQTKKYTFAIVNKLTNMKHNYYWR